MGKEALRVWMELSADIRSKLLRNVWCPDCRTAVTICDYNADFDGGVVVLRGFCGTCGHKVAQVLEECRESQKKAPRYALEYYIFDVSLYGDEHSTDKKKIIRKIQIAGTKSLYNFAKVITQAFGFYFDHCFGFYNNFQRYGDSSMAYELFLDVGEAPLSSTTKGVKKIKIKQAFKSIGEKTLFLFDYGDEWRFAVELKEIKQAEKWDLKPKILESIGKAPLQYPPCDGQSENEQ
jgi:hypothetical protein